MRRLLTVLMLGGMVIASFQSGQAMRKLSNLPGLAKDSISPSAILAKMRQSPSLTAAQMATMKRRILTARSGLDRVHVFGKKTAPIPPEALDALAEWRDNMADDVEIWWDSDWRTPFFIKGNDLTLQAKTPLAKKGHNTHVAAALGTFSRIPGFLGLRDCENELRVLSEKTDDLGMSHVRLQQTYRGYDVWARDLYVHFTPEGRMNLISGRWAPTPIRLDGTDPIVTSESAKQAVIDYFADRDNVEIFETELMVFIDSDHVPNWAWRIRISLSTIEAYDVFINGVSGELLLQVSLVYNDGPVIGSGKDLFNVTRTIHAWQDGSFFYMINASKDMYDPLYWGIDKGYILIDNYGPLWDYRVYSSNLNSWSNPAAVSAAFIFDLVYDYIKDTHGRSSFDGQGRSMHVIVNDPIPRSNGNNAYFNMVSKRFVFGTGDGSTCGNFAAGVDIIGHEVGHGIIDATAGLKYLYQPGAINESFADIFGTMTEFYIYGEQANWLIGEDVVNPSSIEDGMRDMANPENGDPPQPSVYSEFLDTIIQYDHGGVHINSGIPNRAFYLIAQSLGIGKADSLFYYALTTGKLTSYAQFIDLRLGILQSVAELYPANPEYLDQVAGAYDAVEIFDGTGTPALEIQPAPTSNQWIVMVDEQTGRVTRYDTSGAFLNFVSNAISLTKPSIPDSAEFVYFVDDSYNVRLVKPDGTGELEIGDPSIRFANIGVSPDGNKLAFDLEWNDTLFIFDLADTTGASDAAIPLYTPTYDGLLPLHNVLYSDVIEWDIYGERIICDCLNYLPRQFDSLFYWDIFIVDPSTGVVDRALPSVPTGTHIGFPTWGKIHPDIIAFDFVRDDDTVMTYVANLSHNTFLPVTANGLWWGAPSFSPDDEMIAFQFFNGANMDIWRIRLDLSTLETVGDFELLTEGARLPNWRFEGRAKIPVGILEQDEGASVPSAFTLHQNYPNPFNTSTVISFETPSPGLVRLEIFNILGQRIFEQQLDVQTAGSHTFRWDGLNQTGADVPSGIYFYRVSTEAATQSRKMVLLK